MNRKIILRIGSAVFLVFATGMAALLAQSEEQIERFQKEKEAYYNEKLELSEAEVKAFWPLYNDFNNRNMKLMEEERNAFVYAHKNAENLSNEEINEILGKIQELKQQKLKLETKYYQDKFPEVLPPKKVLKLYKVEWDFRRYLLRKLRNEGQGENQERGGSERGGSGNRPGGPTSGASGGAPSGHSGGPSGHSGGPSGAPVCDGAILEELPICPSSLCLN